MMKVAILGYGTVGGGVGEILSNRTDMSLVRVYDRHDRSLALGAVYTADIEDIFSDSAVDTVVECMGGHDFAYACICRALSRGINVVTSNKEVVALHLEEFLSLAEKHRCIFRFEAAVGGGIPLISPLIDNRKLNRITSIAGILNGTTNFCLTKMQSEGVTLEQALQKARGLGFAEADPTADLMGLDMVRKIAILSSLAYGFQVDVSSVRFCGIAAITQEILADVKSLGLVVKFVASSRLYSDRVEIGVEPVLLSQSHPFASVNDEYNAVMIDTEVNGPLMFYGKGAGRLPTASAVVSDLIAIGEGKRIQWITSPALPLGATKGKYYEKNGFKARVWED